MSMSKRSHESIMNAGYEIVMMEAYSELEDGRFGVALGRRPSSFPQVSGEPYQYVTWGYTESADRPISFYWGHYSLHKDAAYEDYHNRLAREYAHQKQIREESEEHEG